jgi:acyl-coenzyme A thioesterase PaaI-like protein
MPESLSLTQTVEQLRSVLVHFNELEFMAHWGARVEILDACRIRAVVDPVQPVHRGGLQGAAVNGGVLSAIFDLTLGIPGFVRAWPERRSATVQISLSFMRAVRGDSFETTSWIERGGSSLLFTQAETRDAKQNLCATASGVVRLLDAHSEPRTF